MLVAKVNKVFNVPRCGAAVLSELSLSAKLLLHSVIEMAGYTLCWGGGGQYTL